MRTIELQSLAVNHYERAEVFTELLGAVRELTCEALAGLIGGVLDDEVTHRLGRAPSACREDSGEAQLPWVCGRCGNRRAAEFKRNGHYRRNLQTTSGAVTGLRVPMVRCRGCGAAAVTAFAALRKHKQLWLDVEAEVVFAYGAQEGLRHIADRVGRQLGWPVSASTIQARVHMFTAALEQWQARPIADAPDVLMVDGIWFTMTEATGERTRDRKGRRRRVERKVKRVALIALGLWSETGRREILDFEIATGEDEDSYLTLLNRLHLRGVTDGRVEMIVSDGSGGLCAAIETVYPTVARQRCVFHKLKNVNDNLRDPGHRKAVLQEAATIYEATTAQEARRRLETFAGQWRGLEPEAVASLETDFEASIAYLGPLSVRQAARYRTTNAVEGGVMRTVRRTFDRAGAFRSPAGAASAIFLCVARLNAGHADQPWSHRTKDIITALYRQKP